MIIPSVDVASGRAVQLIGGRELVVDAGDPTAWIDRFAIAGEVALIDLDAALGRGSQFEQLAPLCRRAECRVGGGIRDLSTAIRWLDAGAAKIIIGTAAEPSFLAQLPRDRVIVALDAVDGTVVTDGWRNTTGRSVLDRISELQQFTSGFLVTMVEREGRMVGPDVELAAAIIRAAGDVRVTIAGGVTTADDVATIDRLGADAQVGMALYTGRLDLGDAIAAPLVSDRADGLFPTVVVDQLGTALGLAWSTRETIRRAVAERQGVYWSRRRGEWVKGASSGATQQLVGVALDCDRDALRFTVRQAEPGFCHTGSLTCWDDAPGIGALERTINARVHMAPEGSYTRRLLANDTLLASKLVEEAGELAEARSTETATREAADLLYFAIVTMVKRGVTLADVSAELAQRGRTVSRRRGDAKPPAASATTAPFTALRRCTSASLPPRVPHAIDDATRARVNEIVGDVRAHGFDALRRYATALDGWNPDLPLVYDRAAMAAALDGMSPTDRALLERLHCRVTEFANAQRGTLHSLRASVPGGHAGHDFVPVRGAGCYVPAGRYPLPSSLMMTVAVARAAGVATVWIASPRPSPTMLAAAAIAGADGLIAAGGAHAVAALAYGTDLTPPSSVVAGPGNKWVTAAKHAVAADVGIDMLAGPSELVILADDTASAAAVAADLLAQAEHDVDALPILVTTSAALVSQIDRELSRQLADLPARDVATAALANGYVVHCDSLDDAVRTVNTIAPEHLQIVTARPDEVARSITDAGAIFIGGSTPEVFGDYGAGPNHVLPTGGAARHTGGLSVLTFLRCRTWLALADPRVLASDVSELAAMEGLIGHQRAGLLDRVAISRSFESTNARRR